MFFKTILEWCRETAKYRTITYRISRSGHYHLQMICDAINKKVDIEYELTPEMITTRVMETFVEEAFSDSTNKIISSIVPELRKKRSRVSK